jgi:hypothetical protein
MQHHGRTSRTQVPMDLPVRYQGVNNEKTISSIRVST